ncbi:hypothetical protein OHB06_29430 [Streptomyces sp. NBC_01604]|uniref:hypothetical protein n=1 Tax=Streptomyces sp. NBC_01604 TaxID=2975894 RepID=UPI003870972D
MEFWLTGVKCFETTDGWGSDQVTVWFRGSPMFDDECDTGDWWELENTRADFEGPEKVWVKERDAGTDELIGSFWVTPDMGPGLQVATLTGDGSHYDIHYAVGGA